MAFEPFPDSRMLTALLGDLPAAVFLVRLPRERAAGYLDIVYTNPYCKALLNAHHQAGTQACGWPVGKIHREDRRRIFRQWHRMLRKGVFSEEFRLLLRGENYVRVRAHMRTFPGQDGRTWVAGLLVEIDRQRSLTDALADFHTPLRKVIDLVPHMIFAKDSEGRFLLANETLARAHATTTREIIGKTNEQLPGAKPEFRKFLRDEREVLRTGRLKHVREETFTTADGEIRVLETTMMPFTAPDENLRAVLGVAVDITARKHMEQEAEASRARLRHILNASPAAVYVLAPSGNPTSPFRVSMISAGIEAIVGYSADAWLSSPTFWVDHLHPEDRPAALARQPMLFETGELDHQYRFRHRDGHYRWIHDKLRIVRGVEGETRDVIGSWMDITAEKEMADALRASEARFRGAFETAVHGMALVSPEGRWVKVNRALCNMLGYTEEELAGTDFQSLTHPDDLEHDLAALERLLNGEIAHYHTEKRLIHKTGRPLWILKSAAAVRDGAGNVIHVLAQIQDITHRRHVEAELRHAKEAAEAGNRAKTLFLANISHELRTPLNGIIGFAQVLQKNGRLPPGDRETIALIARSADYLLKLISDILDFARAETKKLSLKAHPFAIAEFLADIVDMFRLSARNKGIGFKAIYPEFLPHRVVGDEKRLRQVLINILGNAVKFTETGKVLFQLEYREGAARFIVEDSGIGIDPRNVEKIFEPFEQTVGENVSEWEGAGLGLSISKKIVELMGGTLTLQSSPERGTRFEVEVDLPAAADPGDSAAELLSLESSETPAARGDLKAPSEKPSMALRDRIFLVADDNDINRQVLCRLLKGFGAQVLEAEDGERAAALIRKVPFDILFLDLRMPKMDGLTLMTWMREHPSVNGEAPVVAVTAHAFPEHRQAALDAGFFDCLVKPVYERELARTIARALQMEAPPDEEPPPESSSQTDAAWRIASLLKRCGDNLQLADLILRSLFAELPEQRQAVEDAMARSDFSEAREIVHKINGSMSLCGFSDIRQAASDLEAALAGGEPINIEVRFDTFGAQLSALIDSAPAILSTLEHVTTGPDAPSPLL